MNKQEITVFYKWTAKPGKLDELKAIYQEYLGNTEKANDLFTGIISKNPKQLSPYQLALTAVISLSMAY